VRNLVLSAEVFGQWPADNYFPDLEKLQWHTLRLVAADRSLTAGTPLADDTLLTSFAAGHRLLGHPSGKLAMQTLSPEQLKS